MTESQQTSKKHNGSGGQAGVEPRSVPAAGSGRRTNAEAIAAGLGYLLQQRRNGRWGHLNLPWGIADAGVTACVLARLGELPPVFASPSLQRALAESLDWLQKARTPDAGWGYPGEDDAESTAWAVIALHKHGRPAPDSALELIRRCRRPDGGFAYQPEGGSSSPETTALAIQALGSSGNALTLGAAAFISSWLEVDGGRLASPLLVCSVILDWERGLAPLALLNQACRRTACLGAESALEQALLLRCLVRLRLNRAWSLAASLRAGQLEDGSWPDQPAACLHFDDRRIIPTATAVSALVLGDFQPGLYFGSDLPQPRRLHES